VDQPLGGPVMVSEIKFFRNGREIIALLKTEATTRANPYTIRNINGSLLRIGYENYVIDGNPLTVFSSLNATSDDDADPALIVYSNTLDVGFYFDSIVVFNIPHPPLQHYMAGARVSVFYFSNAFGDERIPVFNGTCVGTRSSYTFVNIPLNKPTASPTKPLPTKTPVSSRPSSFVSKRPTVRPTK